MEFTGIVYVLAALCGLLAPYLMLSCWRNTGKTVFRGQANIIRSHAWQTPSKGFGLFQNLGLSRPERDWSWYFLQPINGHGSVVVLDQKTGARQFRGGVQPDSRDDDGGGRIPFRANNDAIYLLTAFHQTNVDVEIRKPLFGRLFISSIMLNAGQSYLIARNDGPVYGMRRMAFAYYALGVLALVALSMGYITLSTTALRMALFAPMVYFVLGGFVHSRTLDCVKPNEKCGIFFLNFGEGKAGMRRLAAVALLIAGICFWWQGLALLLGAYVALAAGQALGLLGRNPENSVGYS